LAGIAVIPTAFLFLRRIAGSAAVGLLGAALIAFEGSVFGWYSQEARPYALVQWLGLVHLWIFYVMVQSPSLIRRACFVAATVALFYLHYTSLLIVLGEVSWYAWRTWRIARPGGLPAEAGARYSWRQMALDLSLAGLCCLPALAHLGEIAQRRDLWSQFVKPQSPWAIFTLFSFGPAALGLLLVAGLAWLFDRKNPQRGQDRNAHTANSTQALSLLCLAYFVPSLAVWLTTWTGAAPLFYPRYLLVVSTALPMAAACGMALLGGWPWRAAYAVAALLLFQFSPASDGRPTGALASYRASGSFTRHTGEDWRGAIAEIKRRDPEGRFPVFLWPGLIEANALGLDDADGELREYLLFPLKGIYSLDDGRALTPKGQPRGRWLSPADVRLIARHQGGWILIRAARVDARTLLTELGAILPREPAGPVSLESRHFRGLSLFFAGGKGER
jgi:hypothetical protein